MEGNLSRLYWVVSLLQDGLALVFAKPGRVEFHIDGPILRLTILGPLVRQLAKILERLNQSQVSNHHCHPDRGVLNSVE